MDASPKIKLEGGTVYDPANQVDGQVQDLWIVNGKLVPPPPEPDGFRIIDVAGRVVMPGGIDLHCHVAGPKVNAGRTLQPEQAREHPMPGFPNQHGGFYHSGSGGSVPTLYTTGYRYAGLGYTTCFDAAISPLASKHAHFEFQHIPNVDAGCFTLVGNNHFVMQCAAQGDESGMDAFLGWLLTQVGGYAPKIVNPGGVELWKQARDGNATDLDQRVSGFEVTPRQIIRAITQSTNRLNLPHPVHIHTNNLGIPGNWTTTLETLRSLDGLKAHLAHVQFHSYGGGDEQETSLCSRVAPLAEFINQHPEITVDVGQVMFGRTTSMTGDGPLGHYLHQVSGEKWYCYDTELESGCGVSPIEYKNSSFVNSLQWAIGLEWYLLVDDAWQVAMSTDHPNGGNFLAYPQVIRLLMDSAYRQEILSQVHPDVLKHSQLPGLTREYTLSEIAIITRAGPARILGLNQKGHLGVGADADVCIYTPNRDFEQMFQLPWMVLKHGQIVIEDAELRDAVSGKTLVVTPQYDTQYDQRIEHWFDREYSLPVEQFRVPRHA